MPVTAESMSQHGSLGGICGLQRFFVVTCRFKWCNRTHLQLNASCFPQEPIAEQHRPLSLRTTLGEIRQKVQEWKPESFWHRCVF